ncbi:MAG: hypothetical protein ABSD97_11010 [Acidimicrobiales bacterium]|jgi:hypothetical protein
MANGPPEMNALLSGAGEGDRAARAGHRYGLRLATAVATAGVLVGLVACDIWVAGVRAWWDRHSFTSCVVSSLLVLGVTVLIIDEVLARRQRKERTVSVAVQAVIVYGQAHHSYEAVMAEVMAGAGGGGTDGVGAERDDAEVDAHDEVRSLASMLLVASPALFDDPEARLFLEDVQRLAATMYGALALHKISPAAPPEDGDGTVARLHAGRLKMDARVRPLAARLADKDRVPLEALADLASRPVPAPAQERSER